MCTALPSVGFIGLGIMGWPMARHLCDAGYSVTVYNRTASRAEEAATFGAFVAKSPRELGERSDILITMLTGPAAVRAVIDGPDGALVRPKKGLVWLQMSTLDIRSTLALAADASAHGVAYIDCPVTGSRKQAEAAELILLAGGEGPALDYVRPLLTRLGKTVMEAGPVGAGTALKLCMNLVVAQMTTALAESAALAEAVGLNPELILRTLQASPALNCGYFAIKGPVLLKREFAPAFSLDNLAKDVGFMREEASARGLRLPVTEAVYALLEQGKQQGLGAKDCAAVLLALQASRAGAASKA